MSMHNKQVSLAVSAIVAASAGVAMAGGVSVTPTYVSSQYVAAKAAETSTSGKLVACNTAGCALQVKLNAEYAPNDRITLTFTSGALVDTSLPTTFNASVGSQVVNFGLASSNSSEATYRVISLGGTGTTVGAVGTIAADKLVFNAAAMASGVTVSFSAKDGTGATFDSTIAKADLDAETVASSGTLIDVRNQFKTAASSVIGTSGKLDAVIDVSSTTPLTRFAAGTSTHSTTADVLTVQVSDNVGGTGQVNFASGFTAAVSAINYTLKGDFSWAVASKASSIFSAACNGATTLRKLPETPLVAAVDGSYSWSCLGQASVNQPSTLTITNSATGALAKALTAGKFTLDASVAYVSPQSTTFGANATTASSTIASGLAAGEWTINGAQIYIPYMPYGDGIDQIIYLANKGTVSGDISMQYVSAETGSTLSAPVKIGTMKAMSTQNILGLIRDALPAAAKTGGRLAIIITVNAPTGDVDVLASYRIGTDRAFVQARKL